MKAAGLEPDAVSYRTLLYAFSIRNMVREAEALIEDREEHGLQIDEYTQSALSRMYVNAWMLKRSWAWFEKHCEVMSAECFSANIDAFREYDHLVLAEKAFFRCLDKQKLSVIVFNVMSKAYGMGKRYDKACELFDSMGKYDISPDKCTYSSLIQILSGAEQPYIAVAYLRKMKASGFISDCIPYSTVIGSFAKLGEVRVAVDLFKEMISFGLQPDIVVYSILINAFAEIGLIEEASIYVDLLKRDGFSLNSIICNSLIKLYTKLGYLREAQEIYKLMRLLDDGPDVYSSNYMIDMYSENSMVNEAEEIFEYLKLKGAANEFAYAMMLCLYNKSWGIFRKSLMLRMRSYVSGLGGRDSSTLLEANGCSALARLSRSSRTALAQLSHSSCNGSGTGILWFVCSMGLLAQTCLFLRGCCGGDSKEVDSFYDFWYAFKSWREFPHADEFELEQSESRDHKRWMERQNAKLREKARKEEYARVRSLIDNAYKRDPRVLRRKEQRSRGLWLGYARIMAHAAASSQKQMGWGSSNGSPSIQSSANRWTTRASTGCDCLADVILYG